MRSSGAHRAARPISPCGRSASTAISSANDSMLLADGVISSPAIA
jgi:hypothetical protein